MKKFVLILLAIPFTAFANFVALDAVDHVSKSKFAVYMQKDACEKNQGSSCVRLPKDFTYEYYEKVGNALVINASKKAAYEAQKASDEAARATKKADGRAAAKAILSSNCSSEALSAFNQQVCKFLQGRMAQ